MQKLVIIRGLPGSGKSKIAHDVYRSRGYWMVEYDHFFKDNAERKVRFDARRKHEAMDWIVEQMRRGLDAGKNVVVTGLFTRRRDIRDLIKHANLPKACIQVIVAHGGKGPNAKYNEASLAIIRQSWEEVPLEIHRKLDPAQGVNHIGPRRLVKATPEVIEETPPVEETIKPTKPVRSMFRNLSESEKARLTT